MIIIYYTSKKVSEPMKFEHRPKKPIDVTETFMSNEYIPLKVISKKLYTFDNKLFGSVTSLSKTKSKEISSGPWAYCYFSK